MDKQIKGLENTFVKITERQKTKNLTWSLRREPFQVMKIAPIKNNSWKINVHLKYSL